MGFSSSQADPDVWYRVAKRENGEAYYEYVLLYTDDCLVISESHLDNTVLSSLLSITAMYEPLRHDRPLNGRYGGGCLIYVSQRVTYQHKTDKQLGVLEHLWVDIKVNEKMYSINSLYTLLMLKTKKAF